MFIVDPQRREAPAVGLLRSAFTPTAPVVRTDAVAERGLPVTGYRLSDACSSAEVDRALGTGAETVEADPFLVEAVVRCSTLGGVSAADVLAEAAAYLPLVESAAIARELWTGELAAAALAQRPAGTYYAHPSLASQASDLTPGGGAVSPKRGLAVLEDALAGAFLGAPRMVHATVGTLGHLDVRPEGALRLTKADTSVVADAGYPGTGPTGAAPAAGEAWLYGSGMVTVRRGPVEGEASLDREQNTAEGRASRLAVVTFSGPVYAVRVTLT